LLTCSALPPTSAADWLTWARGCGKWRWLICTQDREQQADGQDCQLGGYRGLDPKMMPLRDLGLLPLCHYLNKSVLLLPVNGDRPSAGRGCTME